MRQFVLDTSALIALLDAEEGAERVVEILGDAADNKAIVSVSVASLIEVFYVTRQELGAETANDRLLTITDLAISASSIEPSSVIAIGNLKANHKMSFADCCVAELALRHGASLVHKDPEFEQLKGTLALEPLPYKKNA